MEMKTNTNQTLQPKVLWGNSDGKMWPAQATWETEICLGFALR
jgi:hypothetical protein